MAKTTNWCVQEYLKTVEDIKCYLEAALAEKDNEYLTIAVKDAIIALERLK